MSDTFPRLFHRAMAGGSMLLCGSGRYFFAVP